ncbi:unnamed protein product [Paramecium sonneborni]|uniref:Uncharacterized protein n=1 Tax=Paramecium sonneborni TaxID=65129 RepID=A0A8S1RRS6_9CILI|nr:unnamed protein product [Paramecium sonneborni]
MKNEGYPNIGKFGNILYAMIENIKNPPDLNQKQEDIFQKRIEIMDEVKNGYTLQNRDERYIWD